MKRMLFLALAAILFLIPEDLLASHFRYGNVTWSRVAGPPANTVKFKVTQAYRRSYPLFGNPNVGSMVNVGALEGSNLNFGDATPSVNIILTVTSVNLLEDWFVGEFEVNHTYAAPGNYTAFTGSCCRLDPPVLQNNAGVDFKMSAIVTIGNNNDAPVATIPAIVNLPVGQNPATFQLTAVDPNGDALTYSLSPGGSGALGMGAGTSQPAGISITPAGLLQFNTVGKLAGQFWNTSVTITDANGAVTQVDFLMRMITQVGNPPVFLTPPTPANNFTFSLCPGQNLSFLVSASDGDPADMVSLSAVGVPIGASFAGGTNPGNPASVPFSWTPTALQLGTFQVDFIAQDIATNQTHNFVNINVSLQNCLQNTPPFFNGSTPPNNTTIDACLGTTVEFTVQAADNDLNDQVTLTAVDLPQGAIFAPGTNPGNPAIMNFTWTPASSGSETIEFVADDGEAQTSTFVTISTNTCCSYTQGFFGNAGGMGCDGTASQTTTALLDALLTTDLQVGHHDYQVTVLAGSSAAVIGVLPGGGPAAPLPLGEVTVPTLPNSYLKKGRINNSLLAQTIVLALNMRNNAGLMNVPIEGGMLVTQATTGCGAGNAVVSCAADPGALQGFNIPSDVATYLGAGATVLDLLQLANEVLGNELTAGSGGVPSLIAITAAVDAINNAFDECRVFVGYDAPLCPAPLARMGGSAEEAFNIYPNPGNGMFNVVLSGNADGAAMTVTDLSGKLLHSETLTSDNNQVNLDHMSKGVYLVVVKKGAETFRSKLIIQ